MKLFNGKNEKNLSIESNSKREMFEKNGGTLYGLSRELIDYDLAFYAVKKMLNEYNDGCEIVKLLGPKEKQFPMVRYQLQMFLEELYNSDINDFIKALEQIGSNYKIATINFSFLFPLALLFNFCI